MNKQRLLELAGVPLNEAVKSVKVVLTFDANDLQSFLDAAAFGDNPRQLEDLSPSELKDFTQEIIDSGNDFKEEIVESAEEWTANDWLSDWGSKDEEEK